MASSTSNLDLISSGQAQKEITENALSDAMSPAALFGRRASTTAGLTWGFYGGNLLGVDAFIENGTVQLSASTTNIVQANKGTGAVTVAATLLTDSIPLYAVVTSPTGVMPGQFPSGGYKDLRPSPLIGGSGGSYTLPTASTTVKGGARVDGTTLTMAGDVMSAVPVVVTKLSLVAKAEDYTLQAADAGNGVRHPSTDGSPRTFTIPSNAAVQFEIGTCISFANQNNAGAVTIAINTDTLRLAVVGSTGNRTLAPNGLATAIKVEATEWMIAGAGLS